MATHSSILAWRIPWTEEPGGLQSTGSQRVGHDWATSLSLSGMWVDSGANTVLLAYVWTCDLWLVLWSCEYNSQWFFFVLFCFFAGEGRKMPSGQSWERGREWVRVGGEDWERNIYILAADWTMKGGHSCLLKGFGLVAWHWQLVC